MVDFDHIISNSPEALEDKSASHLRSCQPSLFSRTTTTQLPVTQSWNPASNCDTHDPLCKRNDRLTMGATPDDNIRRRACCNAVQAMSPTTIHLVKCHLRRIRHRSCNRERSHITHAKRKKCSYKETTFRSGMSFKYSDWILKFWSEVQGVLPCSQVHAIN